MEAGGTLVCKACKFEAANRDSWTFRPTAIKAEGQGARAVLTQCEFSGYQGVAVAAADGTVEFHSSKIELVADEFDATTVLLVGDGAITFSLKPCLLKHLRTCLVQHVMHLGLATLINMHKIASKVAESGVLATIMYISRARLASGNI